MEESSDLYFDGAVDENAWPPGFRFHPTDEELVLYYLKRKMCRKKLKLDMIRETDVYKWDPEELPGQSILKTGDRQWFFFSPRDRRKYPNAARSNRATGHGHWKATGKDRNISCNSRTVGVKKTLVFYKGRLPNAQRTDWVMHEYTLDEDELKRCQNVKDDYALCKVFKKSGPGPKNGEQYGALFREEEWLDDDECQVANESTKPSVPVVFLDDARENEFSNNLETLMKQTTVGRGQQQYIDYGYMQSQVAAEENTQLIHLGSSFTDAVFHQPPIVNHSSHQSIEHTSFDVAQLETHIFEKPEVTSAYISKEDFLELNDLYTPEPTLSSVGKLTGDLQLTELDGLSEFDLYEDASMYLHEIAPIDDGLVSYHYMNSRGEATVNHPMHQLPLPSVDTDLINGHLWIHEQSNCDFVSTIAYQAPLSQPQSGVLPDLGNHPVESNENRSGATSTISSALWKFVESIPSTPASASEIVLVNQALEQMSSFGRTNANARISAVTGTGASTVRRAGRKSRFFILWMIGALCAMLWLLIGIIRIPGLSFS